MNEVIAVLLVVFLLMLAGCLEEKAKETAASAFEADSEYVLSDSDLPFIGENDTVEIGEML